MLDHDGGTMPEDGARPSWVVVLVLTLLQACAHGQVGGRTEGASAAATPAPAASASPAPSPTPTPEPIDFAKQIQPLLEEKCTPCHFPGGRMYDRLPFDREETIRTLGQVLFTRLQDPVDREMLRTFLAQPKDTPGPPAP
jgi:hypothetical protein